MSQLATVSGIQAPQVDQQSLMLMRWQYECSLLEFMKSMWRFVEPVAFVSNWHVESICDHLEAVMNGELKKGLLINCPPRHMKSLGVNVFFPAFVWAQDPDPDKIGHGFSVQPGTHRGPGCKFMHLSYDARLSRRDSVKCRQIIRSPLYQQIWGDRFQLRSDQDEKSRFDNLQGGFRFATSETGLVTGEGADIVVFDDPHNVRTMSDDVRQETIRFWDEAMPSRLNDQENGVFIVVMQRVHENDLSGHILATELGWTHLCLPAIYEANHPFPMQTNIIRRSTGRIWSDPRSAGEPLWKEKFPLPALQRMAKDEQMTGHVAAGQLQQRPTAREGGLFKRSWFEVVKAIPAPAQFHRVRAWDLAGTSDKTHDPDFTVGLRMCRDPITGILYIDSVLRERWSPAEVERNMLALASSDGYGTLIRIPQDPGQAGKFQVRYFATKLSGYRIRIEPETVSKENRADAFAAQCEVGNVKLVDPLNRWSKTFIEELCAFPNGAHDDMVDAASAAFRALVSTPNTPLQGRYSDR
jgi:predicted phage terminase large subunit-like protein